MMGEPTLIKLDQYEWIFHQSGRAIIIEGSNWHQIYNSHNQRNCSRAVASDKRFIFTPLYMYIDRFLINIEMVQSTYLGVTGWSFNITVKPVLSSHSKIDKEINDKW